MTERGAGCWESRLSGSARGRVATWTTGEIMWHRRGSGQQGRESSGVKVPTPSVTRFGRLAYPLLGEVTNRDRRGSRSHGCPDRRRPGCGRSNLGGEQIWRPEHERMTAAPRSHTVQKLPCGYFAVSRATPGVVKAVVPWEETGMSTSGSRRGMGPSIQRKIRGDNAGKGRLPAGVRSNLQQTHGTRVTPRL